MQLHLEGPLFIFPPPPSPAKRKEKQQQTYKNPPLVRQPAKKKSGSFFLPLVSTTKKSVLVSDPSFVVRGDRGVGRLLVSGVFCAISSLLIPLCLCRLSFFFSGRALPPAPPPLLCLPSTRSHPPLHCLRRSHLPSPPPPQSLDRVYVAHAISHHHHPPTHSYPTPPPPPLITAPVSGHRGSSLKSRVLSSTQKKTRELITNAKQKKQE